MFRILIVLSLLCRVSSTVFAQPICLPQYSKNFPATDVVDGHLSPKYERVTDTTFHTKDLSLPIPITMKGITLYMDFEPRSDMATIFIRYGDKMFKWQAEAITITEAHTDVVEVNGKPYVLIQWTEGESRWWYEQFAGYTQLLSVDTPASILNLQHYASDGYVDGNDKFSEQETSDDCECSQKMYVKKNLLHIAPLKCIDEPRYTSKESKLNTSCLEGEQAGQYFYMGDKWMMIGEFEEFKD